MQKRGGVVTKEEVNTSFSFNTLINALPDKELSPSLPVSRFRNLISFILQQSLPSSPSLSPQPHKYGLLGRTQSIKTAKQQEKTTYTASSEQSTSAPLRGWCLLSFMSFRGLCLCFYRRGCVCEREREIENEHLVLSKWLVFRWAPGAESRVLPRPSQLFLKHFITSLACGSSSVSHLDQHDGLLTEESLIAAFV